MATTATTMNSNDNNHDDNDKNNDDEIQEELERKITALPNDRVLLWPSPLRVAPYDPSQKFAPTKQDREKLAEILTDEHRKQQLQSSSSSSSPSSSSTSRVVIITGETVHYRSAARAVPLGTKGLEIGCAYGDCLAILSKRCEYVVGIDKSVECINRVKEKYPNLQQQATVMDCFVETKEFAKIVDGIDVCCLDIGGDRHADAVVGLVNTSLKDISFLIIKARILYNTAIKVQPEDLQDWWDNVRQTGGNELGKPNWASKRR